MNKIALRRGARRGWVLSARRSAAGQAGANQKPVADLSAEPPLAKGPLLPPWLESAAVGSAAPPCFACRHHHSAEVAPAWWGPPFGLVERSGGFLGRVIGFRGNQAHPWRRVRLDILPSWLNSGKVEQEQRMITVEIPEEIRLRCGDG